MIVAIGADIPVIGGADTSSPVMNKPLSSREAQATKTQIFRIEDLDSTKCCPKGEGQGCPESISSASDPTRLLHYVRNDS